MALYDIQGTGTGVYSNCTKKIKFRGIIFDKEPDLPEYICIFVYSIFVYLYIVTAQKR